MTPWLEFFGRLHPMMLHAPIGLVIGLLALEGLALVRRRALSPDVRGAMAWLVALSAVIAALSGFLLGREGGYPSTTVDPHQMLGIAVGVLALAAAIVQQVGRTKWYAAAMLLCGIVLIPTGHLGASLTHGEDFLLAPFEAEDARSRLATDRSDSEEERSGRSEFAARIQPILEARCGACHGAKRAKGGLGLHSGEAIAAGGDDGPALVAGDPDASPLLIRMLLPLEDDDHMPPASKPQPTEEEIELLRHWITSGAAMDGSESAAMGTNIAAETDPSSGAIETSEQDAPLAAIPVPDPEAIARLTQRLIHAEPISRLSPLLLVDAAAVAPELSDQEAIALLAPLGESIGELSLARAPIGDATLRVIAEMPALRRVNLSATAVSTAGLAHLAEIRGLEEIVLTQTSLTDEAVDSLGRCAALKRLYLWRSGLSPEAIQSLRRALPAAVIDAGDTPDAPIIAGEAPPSVDGSAGGSAHSLAPSNDRCPVTGAGVDPAWSIVHEGRVIGFCCRPCLERFLDDPKSFPIPAPQR